MSENNMVELSWWNMLFNMKNQHFEEM